jgi:phosphoribosyl 1,2-cyclic phosphodiesterase
VIHQARLASRRIVLTHMSADMLAHPEKVRFDTAHDGYVVRI